MSHSYEDVGSLGNGHPLMEIKMNTPTIRTGKPEKAPAKPQSAVAPLEASSFEVPTPPRVVPAEDRLAPDVGDGLFPVRLLRNYRPSNSVDANQNVVLSPFKVVALEDPNDPYSALVVRDPTEVERKKVWAGTIIRLPREEAQRAISLKIAERADEWKL